MSTKRVMIMDDEKDVADFIATVADVSGFNTRVETHAEHFISTFRETNPDVVVLDLQMPGMDGVEALKLLAGENCKAGILLISGMDSRVRTTALRLGRDMNLSVVATLQKPVNIDELENALKEAGNAGFTISKESLEEAIAANQMTVYYQPKLGLLSPGGNAEPVGVEALVRWKYQDSRIIPPDVFLPAVEEYGLMPALTNFVFERAAEQLLEWQEQGRDLQIAINLSSSMLDDTSLPDKFAKKLAEYSIPAERLIIEITESATMNDINRALEILTRFRIKNFSLSIDDFGTGFSSLVELHRMPFTELKIDKSFIMEYDTDQEAQTIVSALIGLAHNLDLKVCAEGVETETAAAKLRALGCEVAQGYLYSKPLPASELEAWLTSQTVTAVPLQVRAPKKLAVLERSS